MNDERRQFMQRKRNYIAAILIMMLLVSLCHTTVFAAGEEAIISEKQASHELLYVVYNAEGEVVEEGTVPASGTRYHWSPNITLDNGWYTSFFKPGREAFYVTNGTSMNFSYTLNRSAKIKWQYVKCTSPDVSTGSTWKSGTKTAKSGSIVKTADSTKWYYVGVTNASSDPITITSVDFTF